MAAPHLTRTFSFAAPFALLLGCGGGAPNTSTLGPAVNLPTVTGDMSGMPTGTMTGDATATGATGSPSMVTQPDVGGTTFVDQDPSEADRISEEDKLTNLVDWAGMPITADVNFAACGGVDESAETLIRPVDVIFVIDNSSSMTDEIQQVQDRINNDLADIVGAAGIDYRIIMVSRYGLIGSDVGESDNPICIGGALGGQDCSAPETTPLMNTERFYHYSADIGSREPWCRLLEGFTNPDELATDGREWTPLAPNGWGAFLRPDSQKSFVVITDDNSACGEGVGGGFGGGPGGGGGGRYQDINGMPFSYSFNDQDDPVAAAQDFDTALLELSPEQFGTTLARKYRWYSIVGMTQNDPPTEPWQPTQPIQAGMCACAPGVTPTDGQDCSVGAGTGFQALSNLTGGLRYPSCNTENFDGIFQAIAEVIKEGAVSCNYTINADSEFNKEEVNFVFRNSAGQDKLGFYVGGPENCALGGWYFDDPVTPTQVVACQQTCDEMQADDTAQVKVLFGCNTVVQ